MGFDLSVRFSDPTWYQRNRQHVAEIARALPSALRESGSLTEVWLKDHDPNETWPYRVRILIKESSLDVEVMSFASEFHRDIRNFISLISTECPAQLIDDDGEQI